MLERKHWILFLFAILLLLLVFASPVGGRKTRRSFLPAEKTFTGTVVAVNQSTCEICKQVELSVLLKTGPELLEVRLGPKQFFEQRDFYLSFGDMIEVAGIRFAERGKEVVLANEVRKAGETSMLRGKSGKPAWFEVQGHTCPVCGN